MKAKFLVLFFTILFIIPFIKAATIEDSINQQISADYIKSQLGGVSPQDAFKLAMQQNPDLREKVKNAVIIISILVILVIIDIILKGFAMWKASKKNSRIWFWLLLIVNSLGILPLLYLIFSKKPEKKK